LRILFSLAVDTRALEDLCHLHSLLRCHPRETVWARDLVSTRLTLQVTCARIVSQLITDRTLLLLHRRHQQARPLVVSGFTALRAHALARDGRSVFDLSYRRDKRQIYADWCLELKGAGSLVVGRLIAYCARHAYR
jgi:hypothetical protein